MSGFERYGAAHLTALFSTAAIGAAFVLAVRASRDLRLRFAMRAGLAALLLILTLVFLVRAAADGTLFWWEFIPLQLCDLAVFLAVYALLSLRPLAYELVYFWGLAGSVVAMLTPDLVAGFPSWEFFFFFALHGGVVVSAILLTFAFGMRPQKRAVVRIMAITNIYAAAIGIVNALTGANFMYLCEKPQTPSLLDWLGPWPFYILGGELVALLFFWLLDLPFRLRYSQPSESKERAS